MSERKVVVMFIVVLQPQQESSGTISNRSANDAFRDNYDNIFRKKKTEEIFECRDCGLHGDNMCIPACNIQPVMHDSLN